jgi:cobaltochelatase CobS
VINELNLASPGRLTALNGIVENGTYVVPDTGELIVAQRGFLLVVCANSNGGADDTGNYSGVQQMNASLVSRFHHIEVPYLSEVEEAEAVQCALQWRTNDMASDARAVFDLGVQRLCKVAAAIRENFTKGRATGTASFPFPIATRQVIAAAEALFMFPAKEPELQALQGAYIRTLPEQVRAAAEQLVRTVL